MVAVDDTKNTGGYSLETAPWRSGLLWIGLAVVGCVAFFWDGIISLLDAWSRPEYSHGPLIPIIAGYLFLRELRNRPLLAEPGGQVPGVVISAMGLFVGLVGNLTQIPYLITYGLIITIGGLILLVAGAKQGARFWVAWAYLLFMLPLPNFMYWHLSVKLQFLSSRLGVDFIQMLGIPVFLDGNIIDLGIYRLQVAEACNGLRYLFPLMSFGFLFATLYRGPFWQKAILFLSSMPITILMNSFRIGVIGALVNSFGVAQAEGFLHWFEGWIIFVACIAILYLEAILLQRFLVRRQTALNILDLDLDTGNIFVPFRSTRKILANRNFIAAGLVLLVSGALWQLLPTRATPVLNRETLAVFPMEINGWRGSRQKLETVIEQALGADEYLLADYVASDDQSLVNLFITFYYSTTDGTGIHSPEICIPGGGWEISRWQQAQISTGDSAIPPFTANRAVIQKGERKQVVYYWFEQRGRRLSSEYTTKLYTVWDSFTKSRADGALIRFVTPLAHGEPESEADRRLTTFLTSVMRIVPDFVPK